MKLRLLLSILLGASLLMSSVGYGDHVGYGEPVGVIDLDDITSCPYADEKLSKEKLDKILDEHEAWLQNKQYETTKKTGYDALELSSITNLCRADLTGANLTDAKLKRVNLTYANLTDAKLTRADLTGASLYYADLTRAYMRETNLTDTDLARANLTDAKLHYANLTDAYMSEANLTGADMREANLTDAILKRANLSGALYVPKIDSLPIISSIAEAKGLISLRYKKNKQPLLQLRKAFYEAGYKEQAREITFAIKHTETKLLLNSTLPNIDSTLLNKIDGIFGLVFFEWTTEWGMSPGNALLTLLSLILFFFFFYLFALQKPTERNGIWRCLPDDRLVNLDKPEKSLVPFNGFWRSIPLALYFSILSAFHFGWRDINVGNWIVRLQFTEYTFQPTGWVRTVAGIQSLISVYLVAIWILTYFGRPFDW